MKKITLSLISLSLIMFSCNKENEIPKKNNFIDTDYYPANSDIAKNEILEFLASTKTYNATSAKTDLLGLDKTPSEGKWLMEGASNYLSNVNLDLKSDTIVEIEIEIENIVSNDGTILMKGSDMVTKFDNLHVDINSIGSNIGKVAKIVDYEINEVSSTRTGIVIKTIFGSVRNFFPISSYPNGVDPIVLFNQYEIDLKEDIGTSNGNFYTNITLNGLFPYSHISDVNNPNYYPEQDPNSSLFNPNLPRCGTNHLGQTDCKICYDCLWSKNESTYEYFNSTNNTWSAVKAQHYYDGTKTVIENFINNGNYNSTLVDVEIIYEFIVCGCPDDGAWQVVNLVLGKGSNY